MKAESGESGATTAKRKEDDERAILLVSMNIFWCILAGKIHQKV